MSKIILAGLDGACPDIIHAEIAAGRLPNFQRLCEDGVSASNLPFPSAVTPGNWISIASGTKPWTNGVSDFCMHTPGAPLSEMHGVFKKNAFNEVELIWDAYARRNRRAATIAYLGALPQTETFHLAIGSSGEPSENADPWTIAPSRALVAGCEPCGPYGWREHESADLRPIAGTPLANFRARYETHFTVAAGNHGYAGAHDFTLYLGTFEDGPGAVLRDGVALHPLRLNQWSQWFEKPFERDPSVPQAWIAKPLAEGRVNGEFRMRLTRLDLERATLLLYISTVYPQYDFSSDPELTRSLRDAFGPYNDNLVISRLLMEWLDPDGFRDEFRLQGRWQAHATMELINQRGFDCVFFKWHAFDKFYHFFMHKIDPAAPGFDPAEAEHYEKLHRMVLEIADEMVGIMLDGLQGDTSLVVISDHGLMASRCCAWVNRYLASNGFISFRPGADGKPEVDWSRTRAYVSSFLLLNINLKGREPQGVVEPGAEYEKTKHDLIELLRGWKDPISGQHIMSDVFDAKADGMFYGLGSDMDGDVRYFTTAGYTLFRSISPFGGKTITDVEGPYLGDHGSCRPTTRFGRGGEMGMFFAAGKGFRKGYRRHFPVTPDSVVPTLLAIAGEKPLAHQEGAVIHDIITGSANWFPR
ncbi:MAG: alkaline phosphatase family protein [Verrucomicrobia bacterium]|nr:alkaline phosphatase family protein [Verrucomicrobiota bacterium]